MFAHPVTAAPGFGARIRQDAYGEITPPGSLAAPLSTPQEIRPDRHAASGKA